MRLFVAINFSDETRSRLAALRDELQSKAKRGNFTGTENLHLTVVFLGECNTTQTIAIKSLMDSLLSKPFEISIDRIGRFKRDGGDLWWAGVRDNKGLTELHGSLTEKLVEAGLASRDRLFPGKRKFSPHITLGREVSVFAMPRRIEPFGETVCAVDLMKSERVEGKQAYTSIYRLLLG